MIVDGNELERLEVALEIVREVRRAAGRHLTEDDAVVSARNDRQPFGHRLANPRRVIEVVMRPDDLGRAFAGHELVRLLHDLVHPLVAPVQFEQRDVIREFHRHRAAGKAPDARRHVDHPDRLRRGRLCRAACAAATTAASLSRRHLRHQRLDRLLPSTCRRRPAAGPANVPRSRRGRERRGGGEVRNLPVDHVLIDVDLHLVNVSPIGRRRVAHRQRRRRRPAHSRRRWSSA